MLLSIDPGPHAGIAYKSDDDEYITTVLLTTKEVYDLIRLKPSVVVIERFAAVQISAPGLYTVDLVGGVKALCYVYDIPIFVHPPQGRYAFQKQAKEMLKKQGGTHMIHEQDALAHLLAYEHWGR